MLRSLFGIVEKEKTFLYSRLSLPKPGYSQCAVYPTSSSTRKTQSLHALYRTKARAPAPTAITLAPNCIAPPAEAEALAADPVAETDDAAAADTSAPVPARTAAQRVFASPVMVWRSAAEQSEFWSRQVVPAAWKALEPVVQRQTGSVGEQPEAVTAELMQAIC
jgi:hypothetical protein